MKAEVDTMIKNLVFDLGNVLIEWNPDKIFRHFETDEMRRQSLRKAIFDSHLWHQTDWGSLSLSEACTLAQQNLDPYFFTGMRPWMSTKICKKK